MGGSRGAVGSFAAIIALVVMCKVSRGAVGSFAAIIALVVMCKVSRGAVASSAAIIAVVVMCDSADCQLRHCMPPMSDVYMIRQLLCKRAWAC